MGEIAQRKGKTHQKRRSASWASSHRALGDTPKRQRRRRFKSTEVAKTHDCVAPRLLWVWMQRHANVRPITRPFFVRVPESFQVNQTSGRSRASCSMPSFVRAPSPRTMPTIPPRCVPLYARWVLHRAWMTGQSRTRRAHGCWGPRCRQRRLHETDRQHSWRQGLGVSCQRRTPARNTCMGQGKHITPASSSPVTSPRKGPRSGRV